MRMNPIRVALRVLGVTIVLYVSVDALFGWIVRPKAYEGLGYARLAAPAYLGEPYFSEDFLDESYRQPGGWDTPEGTALVLPREFRGKYFNIDRLEPTHLTYRRTVNDAVLGKPVITVLLLGGSTVYGSEVPDELTVASELSRYLNAGGNHRFHVINAGVTAVGSSQELERLWFEFERGLRPDVVVALHGVNDIYQGIYLGNPRGGVLFDTEIWVADLLRHVPKNIFLWAKRRGERRVITEGLRTMPTHIQLDSTLGDLALQTANIYANNVMRMNEIVSKNRGRFVSFLQPSVFTSNPWQDDDDVRDAVSITTKQAPGLDKAFVHGMPALRRAGKAMSEFGVVQRDISDAFVNKKDLIFIDFCHVNSKGNAILAARMAPEILAMSKAMTGARVSSHK